MRPRRMPRWLANGSLLVGIAACVWLLLAGGAAGAGSRATEARFRERLALYHDLRLKGDWPALYEMTLPEHRERVDLGTFLDLYGHGMLRVDRLTTSSVDVDTDAGTAQVTLVADGQLQPERLPPQYRASLHVEDPAELRRVSEFKQGWVWNGEDWYFEMDAQALQR